MSYYTNVQVLGSKIVYRGIENGRRVSRKEDYFPTLFVPSKSPTGFTTIYGEPVGKVQPGTIRDCYNFTKQYEDVDGFTVYGNTRYEYAYISDKHPDHIDWDIKDVHVNNIDIECGSENGFPEPDLANETITAITFKALGRLTVLGLGEFENKRDDVSYTKCASEADLLKKFVILWSADYPDVVTGWNTQQFDIPYLVNRIVKVLGEPWARRLSPWGVVRPHVVDRGNGRKFNTYKIIGVASLDYIDLYQRFAPEGKSQENYKLDTIAHAELDIRKLSYEEYGNLHTLYRDNHQLFIEYNIRDVELIDKLEEKLKLIELALTLAYDNKCNFEDVFTQVRMWDVIIFNHLRKKKIAIPPMKTFEKDESYIGAFVKDVMVGRHEWLASFDLTSLYPSLIIQYNISPETLVQPQDYGDTHQNILNQKVDVESLLHGKIDTSGLKDIDCNLTANGQFFRKDREGFMATITRTMFDDRQKYKKSMIAAQKELEALPKDDPGRQAVEFKISRFKNLQLSKKVSLNSLYGASGTPYFRYFDLRLAIAITMSGQLSILWIAEKLNSYMNKVLKTEDKDFIIASDTDSVYLKLDELVKAAYLNDNPTSSTIETIRYMNKVCESILQPYIDKCFKKLGDYMNAYEHRMQMKREALCDTAIWTAPKRYILSVWDNEGVEYSKAKIKVVGLEMVKSSTPTSCRVKLRETVDIVLRGTEDQIIEFIEKYREEFKTLPIEDIASPRGVNGLTKYKGENGAIFGFKTPIHVRGSLIYNHLIKERKLNKKYELIKEGDKIKYIYLKLPNSIQSDIIAFPTILPKELDLNKYIDYDTQYEKAFVEPLKIILNSIGWKTEKVSSLADFFS